MWETVATEEQRATDGEHEWRDFRLVWQQREDNKGFVHVFLMADAIGVESTYLYYAGTRVCVICEYTSF